MMQTYENYVDGEWTESVTDDMFEVRDPANTVETVGRFQASTGKDTLEAVEAAVAAQNDWAHPLDRSAVRS